MNYYQMLENAWELSEAAAHYVKTSGRAVENSEIWDKVFSQSSLVNVNKTKRDGGSPLVRVFLDSAYGLQYRPEYKDWVPFRHGAIDFSKDPALALPGQ